jgi:hypothetical protein
MFFLGLTICISLRLASFGPNCFVANGPDRLEAIVIRIQSYSGSW